MTKNVKVLVYFNLLVALTQGKLDIKCIDGQIQDVPIASHGFGNIYSPGYTEGKPYPNGMNCRINLESAEGKFIRITYNHIDIATNPVCERDRLEVIDVLNNTMAVGGLYCGNITVPDYVSLTNKLIISFLTSPIATGKGFNITYRQVSTRAICQSGELECRNRKCIQDQGIRCNGQDDCGDGTDEEDCDFPVPAPPKCGTPEVQPFTGHAIVDRIVGGREAMRGSWPWQVDMQDGHILPNGHFCGGTLISPQWFITAAHCVQKVHQPFLTRIHLGNHHKYKKDPYEQVRYIEDFFIYGVDKEEFLKNDEFDLSYDLALVKLNAPVLMNPHVQVACLPQPNEELNPGEKCFSTGWGLTRGSHHDDVLKQAEYPIQNGTKCINNVWPFVNKTMICAGSLKPLQSVCHGDSGGPLVCKKDGKWNVYGATNFITDVTLVNWGGLCGLPNVPSVFAKISVTVQWINDIMSNNSQILQNDFFRFF